MPRQSAPAGASRPCTSPLCPCHPGGHEGFQWCRLATPLQIVLDLEGVDGRVPGTTGDNDEPLNLPAASHTQIATHRRVLHDAIGAVAVEDSGVNLSRAIR